jgi:two-component system response regulator PilR (NtrC family)
VPPLRERPEDIVILANHTLKALSDEWEMEMPVLSEKACRHLESYPFPGNVRELENILERAVTLCDDDIILPEHLHLPTDTPGGSDSGEGPGATSGELASEFNIGESLEDYLTDIEKQAILKALEDTRWNRTAAAKKLGMSFRSLRYRLKKLGLDKDEP